MPKPFFPSAKNINSIIRVNHAGEFGAMRIYQGQIEYTNNPKDKEIIKQMLRQELEHLEYFEEKIIHGIRPTIFMPIWHMAGYILGMISAKLSNSTAMLVTESVEEVIEQHYDQQIKYLQQTGEDSLLLTKLKKFQQDEVEHKHIAIDYGSRASPFYGFIAKTIKGACKVAIFISKKL